jgi:hypothetical protein
MGRFAIVRSITLALALVHTFPAGKHLVAFAAEPSWSEGWKGLGAAIAIVLYLLPVEAQMRGLAYLWRKWRSALRDAGVALAVVHLVPAIDHVPALVGAPNWADAWRGIGATLAVAWFLAPLRAQARLISFIGQLAQLPLAPVPVVRPLNTEREPRR